MTLWPTGSAGELDPEQLAACYAYPTDLARPWVRVNFVTSADGAAAVDGLSGGLGSPADKQVFGVLREQAEVVLVGAGTARAENYRGARRPTRGGSTYPPIAVVTGSADIDPGSALLTDTHVPPIVLTVATAPEERREKLAAAGAEVVLLAELTPGAVLAELARRGFRRVLCEGGPSLHGQLLAADAVDELCLTVAPVLAGGDAGRIAHGPHDAAAQRMELASVLHGDSDEGGVLLLRYVRSSASTSPNG